MKVASQIIPTTNIVFSNEFLEILESHLSIIRARHIVNVISPTDHDSVKFKGDYYQLLLRHDIPPKWIYVVMRVNGYTSTCEYDGGKETILVPDFSVLERWVSVSKTKKGTSIAP